MRRPTLPANAQYAALGVGLAILMVCMPGNDASAHVLEESNGIKAILHVIPDDEPKANQPTKISVLFNDETGSFNVQKCTCTVAVQTDGRVLQSARLLPTGASETLDSAATVTFPAIGVYELVVSGSSPSGSFPDFSLDYPERVATAVAKKPDNQGSQLILAVGGGTLLLCLLGWLVARAHPTAASRRALNKKSW